MQSGNRYKPYSYADAGFNGFMRRDIGSALSTSSLHSLSYMAPQPSQLNFDQMQVSGSLGDTFEVGRIFLNGAEGQIDLRADQSNDVVIRIGEIDA